MTREETISRLRKLEPDLRGRGVLSLFLFGSYARGDAGPASDVDLFCDLDPASKLGLAFFAMADRIAEVVERPVDLTTRDGLHPLIRQDVIRTAVQVF